MRAELRREDVEGVAALFDLAGGAGDEAWGRRFEQHITQAMQRHAQTLKTLHTAAERQLETIRVHHELLEVVQERLIAKAEVLADHDLAEALRGLFGVLSPLLHEALQVAMDQTAVAGRPSRTRGSAGAERRSRSPGTLGSAADLLGGSSTEGPSSPAVEARSTSEARALGSRPARGGQRAYAQMYDARKELIRQERYVGRAPPELDLQQLREIMHMVRASKRAADQRQRAESEHAITLEKHLYDWLSRQFRTVHLVDEWARVIISAMAKFAPTHCDVAAFCKVLQHRLAESQIDTLEALRDSLKSLLWKNLRERLGATTTLELDKTWKEWQREGVPLAACDEVVRQLYNVRDANLVMQQVLDLAVPERVSEEQRVVSFRDLRGTVMRFQVHLTETTTRDFLCAFNTVNRDAQRLTKGVLAREQAMLLAEHFATNDLPEDAPPQALETLRKLVPSVMERLGSRQAVTYTECVDDVFAPLIEARADIVAHPSPLERLLRSPL